MDKLILLFGVEHHVTIAQECARAVLIFCYGLLLLRLSGRRTFGHWSALDVVLSIIVGSALGRALTGNAPLVGTMAAAAVLAALHVIVTHAAAHSPRVARIVEGVAETLVTNGRLDRAACRRHMMSQSDLAEALRREGVNGEEGLENVKSMVAEPSGRISVIKYDPCRTESQFEAATRR